MKALSRSNKTIQIFITGLHGVYKLDGNLSLINQYSFYQLNSRGLFYNTSNDHLIVCSNRLDGLFIFDNNLTLIRTVSFGASGTNAIYEYDNRVYVATKNGHVFVLENEIVVFNFSTHCNSIDSILIDQYNCLTTLCSNIVYNYYLNGSFTGVYKNLSYPQLSYMDFDINGDLIFSGLNGLYIFSTNITKYESITPANNTCIDKSN